MQKYVEHMDVFARTPNWFVQLAGHRGNNRPCKDQKSLLLSLLINMADDPSEREHFRKNPEDLLRHIKETEVMYNSTWDNNIMGTELQEQAIKMTAEHMRDVVKDDKLLKGVW